MAGCGTRYLLINYLIGFHGKFGLRSPDTKIIALAALNAAFVTVIVFSFLF
jgi:hypothetical protein